MVGKDLYDSLSSGAQGSRIVEGENALLIDLIDWSNDAIAFCGSDLAIIHANRHFASLARKSGRELAGQNLFVALPSARGTIIEAHCRRTLSSGQPASAEFPSPFSKNSWHKLTCFPLGTHVVVQLRDITEEVQNHRLADVKGAILEAMAAHGDVGYFRVTVRGTIERADEPICRMLGLSQEKMLGIPVIDLVDRNERSAFREHLDAVLSGVPTRHCNVSMLANTGEVIRFEAGLAGLTSAYGAEGAVMVLTRAKP